MYTGLNTRVLEDIVEFCEMEGKDGGLIALDFQKAFDSVESDFIRETLNAFNFGQKFEDLFNMLYNKPMTFVKNNNWIATPFEMSRGVRQGCAVSALVLMCVEILATKIKKNKKVKGIKIGKSENKLSQFADDSTLIVSCKEDVIEVLKR